jgi:restriction endonuclease S subunit
LIPGISRNDILEVLMALPPLEEQKRIVEKVDNLKKLIESLKEKVKNRDKTRQDLKKSIMSEIEKSDSNKDLLVSLEMIFKNFDIVVKEKEDIKDIRDLILSMAVKGKLVEQNPDDLPADTSKFYTYVIKCKDGTLYKGFTNNLRKRWNEHKTGKGAEWTKIHKPLYIIHYEVFDSKGKAIDREKYFKSGRGREYLKDIISKNKNRQAGEPASVLLEKIKEEKERLIKEKKIKKPKKLEAIKAEEIPFDIPDSWEWVRLGEVIELLSGQDISVNYCNTEELGVPYIMGASNIQNNQIVIERWIEKPKVIGIKNDILLSCKGTVGKTIIQNIEKSHLSRQIMGIRKIGKISNNYLKLFIDSYIEKIKDKSQGLIPGISRNDILEVLMALPPLEEQKRIVEKVDKLMNLCDELEMKVEKSKNESDILMKSVLQGVFEG